MTRRALFNGDVHVHYYQLYVQSGASFPDLDDAFRGQSNGLCGAASAGLLWLTTGLHTGPVAFRVEACDEPPPIDDAWEEIVEVSFRPATPEVELAQWAGEAAWPLDLPPVDYRVRYCAAGMEAAGEVDVRLAGEPELDRYLLQFWPAELAPDRIVKTTTAVASYWHGWTQAIMPR